uniref:Anoctamin transmembrane domain-containing protein n=1 Tax=Phytophthora ramorum TaxID=164328 RepID=H3HE90_PHYRM
MSYDSVALGVVASPGASPRGAQQVREVFYYTLVFPVPSVRDMPRVNYAEVCEMLRGVTAGGSSREARAIDEMRAAWEAKFRSGAPMAQDMIPLAALQELMRDVILARFSALPGMTVRSRVESQGDGRLLLSFRPSPALLRATAERLKLGSKDGAKLWGQAEAQEEVYRLFLAGKIAAEDAQIFDYEDIGMWSRRLRALQRFSTDLAALRYVYRQMDDEGDGGGDVDGSTLSPFRVVDKIRLTKALVDAEFDCDALVERGLLEHHFCPHTHRATDVDTSLDVLRARWGAFPTPRRVLALYFAFASFHANALRSLGLLALVLAVVSTKTARPREAEAVFCLCSCAFLGIFVRKWELHEARLAARWSGGTPRDGDNAVNPLLQLPRPHFRGQMRRSPVTLRLEPYSPLGKSIFRRLLSSMVLAAVALELGASNAVLVASDRFQTLTTETPRRFNVALGVIALMSKCATPHLARCSKALTNWENHRLQRDYDSQLTFKFALLQTTAISSHDQAARLLLIMLALDVGLALWGLRWAAWRLICVPNRDASSSLTCSSIEADLALAPYEGVLFDYAQVLVPLGFVAWFAPLAPLSSCVLAWLVAALQIRVDAHSLCYDTQRPFPIQALSLGSWLGYLHVLRIGAVLHSTAFMLMILLDASAADLDNKTFEQRVVAMGGLFAFVGWIAYVLKDHQDLAEERRLVVLKAGQAALESKYLGHLGTHLAASAKATLPAGRVFLNGVPRYVVTGDKSEEDAAEELRDQWRQQQMQMLALEKRIAELRDSEEDSSVGVLYVEVQGSGTSGDSMSLKAGEDSKASVKGAGGRTASPLSTQMANTSVSKKSRSPLWHESFELPVTALGDVLALRVCDGGPMLATVRQRRVLGLKARQENTSTIGVVIF